jgi:hypothetical protein
MNTAGYELGLSLRLNFLDFGGAMTIEALESCPWAALGLPGERHALALRLDGQGASAAADSFLSGLEEREFALDGYILADIALVERSGGGSMVRLVLEALTVAADQG